MEEKKTIFDYLQQALCLFAIIMIIMIFLTAFWGSDAKEVSSFFQLGNQGIPLETMMQFLAMSIIITIFQYLFFSTNIMKKISLTMRTVLMFGSVILTAIVFIIVFEWFPIFLWEAWASFVVSFIICSAMGIGVMTWKTSLENKKLEKALKELQQHWQKEEQDDR